jgi:ABC-type Fe3+/spermidine/putrescine transport system ATPase subunit
MRTELRELQRRLRKTTVYVTHDQGEALALSDRIVVMSNGRIEQIGTPRDIYERPANPFVADFIGNSNLLDAMVVGAETDAMIVRTEHGLVLRASRAENSVGDLVVTVIRPEHVHLVGTDETGRENRLNARIEEATYLGQDLHLRLRVDGKQVLTAVTQGSAAHRHAAGDDATVAIAAADVILLPK